MYTYDEAKNATLEYFGGDDLAADVWVKKYALQDNENHILEKTPTEMHWRIANEFARIEKKKFKKPLSAEEIFDLLDRFKYIIPQGSPMFGIGNNYQTISLSNCYLLNSPEDCYSSILDTDKQLVNISKRRGGVGIDLSKLRPRGSTTKNAAKTSTGILTWMERYSNSIREVGQSNRRGALMLTLSVHHPDVLDFVTVKNDDTKVTGANISLRLTKEFIDAVESDSDYELRFPVDSENPTVSKFVKAKDVWNTIVNSAWLRAEPGLLMWDNVTKFTPADCYDEYASKGTNPCSEINLSELDSCRLLCLNLLSYVIFPFTPKAYFDYHLFTQHAIIAQRLMDDLVDLESEKIDAIIAKVLKDPEDISIKQPEIDMWKQIQKYNNEGRRTGTGITALGDCLAALGINYGQDLSIEVTEKIYKTLKYGCYRSSVDMAKELGSFKCFDWKAEENCPFFKLFRDDADGMAILRDMEIYGRRNICCTTTAPTGTVSMLTQTTSGIEPLFMLGYTRRRKLNHDEMHIKADFVDKKGDRWQEYTVYHNRIQQWMTITGEKDVKKSPWYGYCAEEIDWINRVKLQAAAQKHVCHAISSTINLPEDVKQEKVAEIYITAFRSGLKGITIYRKNCRTGVLLDKPESSPIIQKTQAAKRPKDLKADAFAVSVKGENYFVVVGLLNDDPYEIIAGKDKKEKVLEKKKIENGIVRKVKRGHYSLLFENEVLVDNLVEHSEDTEEALTRSISTALRHGADISFIIHQLEKTKGSLFGFAKAVARALKKYVPDGTKVNGEECPECGKEVIRECGCVTCKGCGWSKC